MFALLEDLQGNWHPAFTTLVTLASQAKQTNRPITCREESDGMIYEIYFW